MGKSITMVVKLFSLVFLASVFLTSQKVKADEVFITGYTNGCFNCVFLPNTKGTQTASLFSPRLENVTFWSTPRFAFGGGGPNSIAAIHHSRHHGAFLFSSTPDKGKSSLHGIFATPKGSGPPVFTATLTDHANDLDPNCVQTPGKNGSTHETSLFPEPASMLLLGTGLVGVAAGLRRRRATRLKRTDNP